MSRGSLTSLVLCVSAIAADAPICFRDVGGIDFVLNNDATPQKRMIETMPGGLAIFDYNNDGRPDIFFTNGAAGPPLKKDGAAFANRLYRNDGAMKFTDVTATSGVTGEGYSMGASVGDFDSDGNVDLFV